MTLDGSGSSDSEGDLPLRFTWTLGSSPVDSTAALENAGSATPSFTPDLAGEYTIGLVVTDSLGAASTLDTVTVVATNERPVADAGDDQTSHPGHSVTLDGSRSHDPDGDTPLTLSWEIVASPEGSTVRLSDPAAPLPSFTPDLLGEYRIRLTVADRLGSVSLPDEVVVSTLNSAPTADAGSDQVIIVRGATVQLDGRGSSDPDGDSLSFVWTMIEKPAGSTAALSNPASVTPTFVADLQGSYLLALVVRDSFGGTSEADLVTVSFENVPPVADAGNSRTLGVGETAFLDGSGSFDANGDPLTYRWSLVTMPEGSRAALDDPASIAPAFVPDRPGLYVINLIVNDGLLDSEPSSLTLTATASRQSALDVLREIMEICAALDPGAFKGKNGKDTLLNKLNAVIDLVDQGLYEEAREKLSHDLLGKLDGCANTGEAGPNDLVTDCDAQARLSPLVVEAIELLRQLL